MSIYLSQNFRNATYKNYKPYSVKEQPILLMSNEMTALNLGAVLFWRRFDRDPASAHRRGSARDVTTTQAAPSCGALLPPCDRRRVMRASLARDCGPPTDSICPSDRANGQRDWFDAINAALDTIKYTISLARAAARTPQSLPIFVCIYLVQQANCTVH